MAEPVMQARTPLAGQLPAGRHGCTDGPPGVVLTERRNLAAACVALRGGDADALARALRDGFGLHLLRQPGCAADGAREIIWTGPGQWLALDASREGVARFGFARELARALGATASVTDLTGARSVLRLSGPAVRDTLAKLVPVDLDDAAFPPGSAAVTLAAHIGVTLWRPTAEAWDIACQRSYGGSLAHDLRAAAAGFGCEVAG